MMASGRPVVVVCRVSVTPAAFGSTMKTPTPVLDPLAAVTVAGTRMASATSAAGTQALVPESRQDPSACSVAVVAGSVPPGRITSPTSSAMAAVRIVSPLATPVSQVCALGLGAELGDRLGAVDHRLDDGHVGRSAASRLDHETGGDEVEAGTADVLAQVDAE